MFEIEKINHFASCQVCGNDASENMQDRIYAIRIMNKYQQGAELRLCSNCCNALSKLTEEPDKRMHGIRMMSIDELEELTNNTKCSII
jgi:hypothetical protein